MTDRLGILSLKNSHNIVVDNLNQSHTHATHIDNRNNKKKN